MQNENREAGTRRLAERLRELESQVQEGEGPFLFVLAVSQWQMLKLLSILLPDSPFGCSADPCFCYTVDLCSVLCLAVSWTLLGNAC